MKPITQNPYIKNDKNRPPPLECLWSCLLPLHCPSVHSTCLVWARGCSVAERVLPSACVLIHNKHALCSERSDLSNAQAPVLLLAAIFSPVSKPAGLQLIVVVQMCVFVLGAFAHSIDCSTCMSVFNLCTSFWKLSERHICSIGVFRAGWVVILANTDVARMSVGPGDPRALWVVFKNFSRKWKKFYSTPTWEKVSIQGVW